MSLIHPLKAVKAWQSSRWLDGKKHEIRVYAYTGLTPTDKWELSGSPFYFNIYDPGITAAIDPISHHTNLNGKSSVIINGWVFDNVNHDARLPVLAFSKPFGNSLNWNTLIGSWTASVNRPDVDRAFHTGLDHGFSFAINAPPVSDYGHPWVDEATWTGKNPIYFYTIDATNFRLRLIGTVWLKGNPGEKSY